MRLILLLLAMASIVLVLTDTPKGLEFLRVVAAKAKVELPDKYKAPVSEVSTPEGTGGTQP